MRMVVKIRDVKLRPWTAEHDYAIKLRKIRELLGEGSAVRVSVVFRGREIRRPELGRKVLQRVLEDLHEIATVTSASRTQGRQTSLVFAPKPNLHRPPGGAAKPRLTIVRPDPP